MNLNGTLFDDSRVDSGLLFTVHKAQHALHG